MEKTIKNNIKRYPKKVDYKKNKDEIKYLRETHKESIRVNRILNEKLNAMVLKGKKLSDYAVMVNEKCKDFIITDYAIEKIIYNPDTIEISLNNLPKDCVVFIVSKKTEFYKTIKLLAPNIDIQVEAGK